MRYSYGLLRTDESADTEKHNASLLGANTLGFEVTSPSLAARCGLGNIDPQHGASSQSGSSAIEEALSCELPPDGATLVTIRPDKDSLGAMAVVTLLAEGKAVDVELVSWIGLMDSMGFQNARLVNPDCVSRFRKETDAIGVIANGSKDAGNKVQRIARILSGEMPRNEVIGWASKKVRSKEGFEVETYGEVAFIAAPGKYGQARDWGNRRYAVTVVFDPAHQCSDGQTRVRWSVVRQPNCFDRRRFEELVNLAEAKARETSVPELKLAGNAWGGPANIVSSPQGRESKLGKDVILALVRNCAEFGQVS